MRPTEACYWIIGSKNKRQAPAVAIDLRSADGSLVRPTGHDESHTISLGKHGTRIDAPRLARAYAKQFGISSLHYDPDSTECFADC